MYIRKPIYVYMSPALRIYVFDFTYIRLCPDVYMSFQRSTTAAAT